MDMKVQAEELPQKFTNQACINDTGNGDGFKFQLSVSKQEVHSKDEGKTVTEFELLNLDTSNLEDLHLEKVMLGVWEMLSFLKKVVFFLWRKVRFLWPDLFSVTCGSGQTGQVGVFFRWG